MQNDLLELYRLVELLRPGTFRSQVAFRNQFVDRNDPRKPVKAKGAGCGYTNGGIGFRLAHSELDVRMPDCARIRADGTNEVAGVDPDVPTEWKDSDPANVRLDKTMAALRVAMGRGVVQVGKR